MATYQKRKRKSGTRITATIRKKQDGATIYMESDTFASMAAARRWATAREADLDDPRKLQAARRQNHRGRITIADLITHAVDYHDSHKPYGRTKRSDLLKMRRYTLADVAITDLDTRDVIAYAEHRKQHDQAGPATVAADLSHLRSILRLARPLWGMDVDDGPIKEAMMALGKVGLVGKSQERDRRPTRDELDRIMAHFWATWYNSQTWGRGAITPMLKIVPALMFTGRRVSELTRITWTDYEGTHWTVRDMKDPRKKTGNHQRLIVPEPARAIIESMPRTDPRIFPHDPKAIGKLWREACAETGIEDLTIHDLRHECTSWLFEQKWQIAEVALVTGHKRWTTLQRYANLESRTVDAHDKWAAWPWLERATAQDITRRGGEPDQPLEAHRYTTGQWLSDKEKERKRESYRQKKAAQEGRQKGAQTG